VPYHSVPGRNLQLLRRLIPLLVIIVVAAGLVILGLPALGAWLVVADPLAPSDAIFVLDGSTPAREVEGAALYHRRLAPVVGISRPRERNTIARRLARHPPSQDVSSAALGNVGVPNAAILRLDVEVENTAEELAVIADAARARSFRRIIIVTSPSHTRRVRMIWDAQSRPVTALVHPTSYESWDTQRWWRSRQGLESVVHELGGMVNFRLGSALPTFDTAR
jgi:uncharacterized SAM-binding protein YcdF (DUF218 family)